MISRKELTFATLFPNLVAKTSDPRIGLIGPDGEQVAVWRLSEPTKGDALARLIPDGFTVELVDITGLAIGGSYAATRIPFDTTVQTERSAVTVEDRLAMLETRERKALIREREARRDLEARLAIKEAKEAEDAEAQVLEDAAAAKAQLDKEAAEAAAVAKGDDVDA